MRTHELHRCPSCGGNRYAEIPMGAQQPLRRCTACHLVYAAEFADPSEIYVDGYLKGETDFGLDIMHPLFQEFLDFAADRRLAILEKATGRPGRLLDVGCGSGEVLRAAERRGWQATGVEPVEESATIARDRGLDVHAALLQESGLPERSFDVVSAFHVLEHMDDGTEFLRLIARWARPGGHLLIEVPNWRSFHRRNTGEHWPGLRPLEHIAHYEPATLAATMERAGLQPALVRTTGFLWEKQTLDQALNDLARPRWARFGVLGRPGEQDGKEVVMPSTLGRAVLRATAWAYDRANVGQVVLGLARVP